MPFVRYDILHYVSDYSIMQSVSFESYNEVDATPSLWIMKSLGEELYTCLYPLFHKNTQRMHEAIAPATISRMKEPDSPKSERKGLMFCFTKFIHHLLYPIRAFPLKCYRTLFLKLSRAESVSSFNFSS